MFEGLTSLKYINPFNVTDPHKILEKSALKDLENLIAC